MGNLTSRTASTAVAVLATAASVTAAETYDVIVIGSGPGGLVAAEYLSRNPGISVLVLEAGGPSLQCTGGKHMPDYAKPEGLTYFDIPGEYGYLAFNRDTAKYRMGTDWIASPKGLWLGKVVGGSSSLNGMLYFHTPDSYVSEASWPYDAATVNRGYAAIESMFKWTDNPSPDGKRYLQDAYTVMKYALTKASYKEATTGMNTAAWRNAKSKTFGHPPFTIDDGLRNPPAKTFLGHAKTRKNFKLEMWATVSHIVQAGGQATAVVYEQNGKTITASLSARGAVIVAGSAVMTPKILIQSGVGPRAQLEMLAKAGNFPGVGAEAKRVVNENVGNSMFDTHQLLVKFAPPHGFEAPPNTTMSINQFTKDKKHNGPLSMSSPLLILYENYLFQGRVYQFQVTIYQQLKASIYLNNPVSRDQCRFKLDGKLPKYRLDTNGSMYKDARDRAALVSFTDKFRKMMAAGGLTSTTPEVSLDSTTFVNSKVEGANHYGGSCYASGDKNDKQRCADETLKVIGTKNIFVGDGSLMKEGTVNPYGFIMYSGYQAGVNVEAAILAKKAAPHKGAPHVRTAHEFVDVRPTTD